ncbi:hypothetical protein [Kaarinaea lacus]
MKRTNLILLIFLLPCVANAKSMVGLYSDQQLEKAYSVYNRNIPYLYTDDFLGRLTFEERFGHDIRLATPLRGDGGTPWEFYALIDQKIIVMPILSIKFLDDLSITFAYMEKNNCKKEMFYNYLTKLLYDDKYKPEPPRVALGIPANALDDHFVDDVSQKLLKSTFFFLLGHEYAHIIYNHAGYQHISGKRAQQQETEADNFSLNVMRRIGVTPMGLALFFTAASRLEAVPSAFSSKAKYEKYIQKVSTHPLTGNRMKNIATYLRKHANDFARLQANRSQATNLLQTIAGDVETIGEYISDGQFREFQFQQGIKTSSKAIRNACK